MIGRLFLLTLVASCYSQEQINYKSRQGKLFLVSSTTATPMTTTTCSLTTSSFPKKRAVVRDPLSDDEFDSVLPAAASISKDLDSGVVEAKASSHRQARVFLYYMTP